MRILVYLTMAAVLFGCSGNNSQPTNASNPQPSVISITPANGSNGVVRNSSITVVFSVAMDKPSTEAGFSVSDNFLGLFPTSGLFAWSTDSKTITWTPSITLHNNSTYVLSLSGAQSSGHVALPSYSMNFVTANNAPHVVGFAPSNGLAGVVRTSSITVTFDRTMNTSTASAMSVSPAIAGLWSVNGTTAIFTPSVPLANNTTYTVTAGTGSTESSFGTPLASAVSASFTTENTTPNVVSITPTNNVTGVVRALSTKVVVTFDRNMDPTSTVAALSISPTLTGGTWSVVGKVATYSSTTAGASWANSTNYLVNVGVGAKESQYLTPMGGTWVSNFTTEDTTPTVVSITPANGGLLTYNKASITWTFSRPMNTLQATPWVAIYPAPVGGTWTWDATATKLTYTPAVNWTKGNTYNIVAVAGAQEGTYNTPMVANYSINVVAGPQIKVFVGSQGNPSSTITTFLLNSTTGALTQSATASVAANLQYLLVDPTGLHLYATSGTRIDAFGFDGVTGALTPVAGSPFVQTFNTMAMAMNATGTELLATSTDTIGAGWLGDFSVAASGAITPLTGSPANATLGAFGVTIQGARAYVASCWCANGSLGGGTMTGTNAVSMTNGVWTGVAQTYDVLAHPNGQWIFSTNRPGTSASTLSVTALNAAAYFGTVTNYQLGLSAGRMALNPAGTLLFVPDQTFGLNVFSFNATTGVPTLVGSYPTGTFPIAVAVDPTGTFVFAVHNTSNDVWVWKIAANGTLTFVGSYPVAAGAFHIAVGQ